MTDRPYPEGTVFEAHLNLLNAGLNEKKLDAGQVILELARHWDVNVDRETVVQLEIRELLRAD